MDGIAIIGMSGRFPGASSVEAFWENLARGVESIARFSAAELESPAPAEAGGAFVKARGVVEGADLFDAGFFGFQAREAELLDPQHRILLECAWEALERGGYDPETYPGLIGIWAGSGINSYLLNNVVTGREYLERLVAGYQQGESLAQFSNDRDFFATRVAYKLNLKGPGITVQTACSTSLVAITQACQSLWAYQTDMALAGGVSISFPQRRGYVYQEGAIGSADGHVRTFDADAQGTVFSSGAGVVLLKRLEDALTDGDPVIAVIKGAAINNDGAGKVSFTAPSVDGQAEVIQMAQALAEVRPETIGFVEAHGTGTPLGDPIEVAGLTQAFRAGGATEKGFCALGSLKTNVGHMDIASGVAALIKTASALAHRQIPGTLHFQRPNPNLDLANSPFHVNAALADWPAGNSPRRAGVSSFGVGGTNAHAVLEEAPARPEPSPAARSRQLFVLSAKTASALEAATANLANFFQAHPTTDAADAAWTLQIGRRAWSHRRLVTADTLADAASALQTRDARRVFTRESSRQNAPVAFLFPGQGAQAVNMGAQLYASEKVFRAEIDRCAELLRDSLGGVDLREVIYPKAGQESAATDRLQQTEFAQPALFVFGYALARLWISWGVRPAAMLGHSVGEYVAACLAGVFSLEDALHLVAARARLVQAQPGGTMLAVRLPEAELKPLLAGLSVEIAAVNAPGLCVVSGADDAVAAFEQTLETKRVACRRLKTSHAFHSRAMEPVIEPFAQLFAGLTLHAPAIPIVSNVTGQWLTASEATDPQYWARHLRMAVRFADGAAELLRASEPYVFLEAGPGQTLAPLVRQQGRENVILSSLLDGHDENETILTTLGRLWADGVPVDWKAFHMGDVRRRVTLPTYPFERKRYWIEPPVAATANAPAPAEKTPATQAAVAPAATAPALPRKEAIIAKIRTILKNLSGQDQASADLDITFLELGFDSLFLTQVAGAFRKEFSIKVTFRQLLEDYASINAVAGYLDAQLPPDAIKPTVVAASAPAVSGSVTPAANDPLGAMQEQLRGMMQQLASMQNGTPARSSAPPVPSVTTRALPAPPKVEQKAFGPYRPIEKSASGGFTARQQAHLDALIARSVARTPKSKQATQENRAHLSDPRTVSGFRQYWKEMVYPIVAARSAGSKLWDIDGNEFVDLTMGFGTNLLGHAPPFVTAALEEQLKLGMEVGPSSPLAGKVAKLLCEMTGSERAAFTNTGSEAVLAAVRLARTVTGRTRIATTGGFHGINDEVLVRANTVDGIRRGAAVAPGIPDHIVQDVVVADYGTQEGLDLLRAHAHELAAVLVEPVQSRRPDLQPREFLHALREITEKAGCVLIFDEVITGFRCHLGGAQAYFGVKADLATWGKVMGGGMPIGAVTGKAEYMDALDGGMWQYGDASFPEVGVTFFAGTYIRHPLTMAASWAILNYLRNEGGELQRKLTARTGAMIKELNTFFAESGVPLHLENFASLFYPHFDDDIKFGSLLYFHLRARGVHIWEGRPCFLSTAHTDADIAFVIAAFKDSVREMQSGGFLPGGDVSELDSPAPVALAPLPVVVEQPAAPVVVASTPVVRSDRPLAFSLYYFGNYPAEYREDKYRIILESARFADAHGFEAVWLPERHFHAVGGFSPNPSLLAAALARDTQRIQLRGGSVVLPLHHPVRVAEEWSLVDNLSHGRTGISIASGWHPNDFIFAPERFERRREICLEDIETIQRLWRGESIPMRAGTGTDFDVRLFPQPVQPQLPVWLTCIHEESFVRAGELGMGVLGYLMNQTVDEVAGKIAKYREALVRAGHDPAKGRVTILVHTFVGEDASAARERARGPLKNYLRSFLDNSQKRLESQNVAVDVEDDDIEYLLEKSFNDYVQGKALIGTPETCAEVVDRLREIGVDEIGCFVDFGVDADSVLASLPTLNRLRERYALGGVATTAERSISLTDSETGLWVLGQTDETALRAYQESSTLELRGPLDAEALHRALNATANRHEALRTVVQPHGESQIIHPACSVDLPLIDLSSIAENERPAALAKALADFEAQSFDFTQGALMRATLVRVEATRHLLLLAFHHLLGNGPSYWVFFEDLCAHYRAAAAGQPPALEPALQLSQYVQWRRQENAQTVVEDETFWLAQFADGVPTLELPADRPRPARLSHRGGRVAAMLPAELVASLRKVAAAQRGSLFMLLLTAFETLVHRLSGQDDLVVGVPFEGEARSQEGGEHLFANTTNVLPLRSRAAAAAKFTDLFAATKELVLNANEHQNYFFGNLLKKLQVRHDPSRTPMFAVFFNYESGKFERDLGAGLSLELLTTDVPYRSPRDTSMFELYLNVAEQGGALLCECDFGSDLYDAATVERWLGHYRVLLEAIARDPQTEVWRLPLLTPAGQQHLLRDWNATSAAYPPERATLTSLFEEQVRRTPHAPAVLFEHATLTYRELDKRANQLANYLRARGVGAETLVAVCLERSLEMVVALYAILKAGGAYVPVDPDYPPERIAFMLGDAKAPVVLTQLAVLASLPEHAAETICLDRDWTAIARESDLPPTPVADAGSLAYVIYTSGSTGQPKGAMNTHRGICNRLCWMQDAYGLRADDRVLQKTPFSFDVSVWEFFWPLQNGAALVLARPQAHGDSDYLAQLIAAQAITTLHFVPPMLAAFLEEKDLPARCASLRRVIASGEALPGDLQARFFEVFEGTAIELHNLYGPTEAAVDVTYHACSRDDGDADVPIGRPVANTQIYLLDSLGQPVPIGVPGELHIGGVQVGRGYLNRPELTAEKFVPDPFNAAPGGRLYRTGDLARWRADGEVMYLGRLDHQVKVRGFRIELGEIEAALQRCAGIKAAVVLAREDRPGDRRLVAYVAADNSDGLSERLRIALRATLPDYMVPAAFVVLPALPLSPNGKVDRRALPAPDFSADQLANMFVAPRNGVEVQVAEIWQRVLGLAKVGVHDNFFEIGGDSLLGLRVVNQLREMVRGEHVSLVVMFEAPTVGTLAALLQSNYAAALAGTSPAPPGPSVAAGLNETDVSRLREIIGHAGPAIVAPEQTKNPRAVFILSPMRSGSTLLRIMLAGNSQLFSPPELQLLQFHTLAERHAAFTGYERYLLEGTERALMELDHANLATVEARMAKWESAGRTVHDFYRELSAKAAPRVLVDKTPDYAMDLDVLRRAEQLFENASYIHLARHPLGMIRSYEEGRFLLESPYRGRHDFSARQMAELTWLISHQNILKFLSEIPAARQHRVRFEEIVSTPQPAMAALASFLGVAFEAGMAEPYENQSNRMTDGVHVESSQVGDHNFSKHGELRADIAEKWRDKYPEDFLSAATWALAAQLGYENTYPVKGKPVTALAELPVTRTAPAIVAVSRDARRARRSSLQGG